MDASASEFDVEIHTDAAGAATIWAELERICPVSVYQTRRFALPWVDTVGAAAGCRPVLAVLNAEGQAAGLLPLMVRDSGGLRRLEFIGGEDSNANMGLFRPGFAPGTDYLQQALSRIAAHGEVNADLVVLANQPENWRGSANPLASLERQQSASQCHSAILGQSAEEFLRARFSKDGRKKLRAKFRKLEEIGPVRLLRGNIPSDARAILDVFTVQKRARFSQMNIANRFDSPSMQEFLASGCLAQPPSTPAIRLYALLAGDHIAAVFGGGVHQGRFSGMFNSFDANPDIARTSPGDQLLKLMIEDLVDEGLAEFDLGIGEARYKQTWCDRTEPLFDICLGVSARGQFSALAERGKLQLKRAIKQSDWAWPLAQKLRRNFKLSA